MSLVPSAALRFVLVFFGIAQCSIAGEIVLTNPVHLKWKVQQKIVPSGIPRIDPQLDKRINDPRTSQQERRNLQITKENEVAMASTPLAEEYTVELDLVNEGKFKAVQTFLDRDGKPKTVVEYFAPGDGLVYTVQKEKKSVILGSNIPLILRGIARSLPSVAATEYPQIPKDLQERNRNKEGVLKLEEAGQGLLMSTDANTGQPNLMQMWSSELLKEYRAGPDNYAGTPFPTTVDFVRWRKGGDYLHQTWVLQEVRELAPDVVYAYTMEPDYKITDQTGNAPVQLPSELFLNTK